MAKVKIKYKGKGDQGAQISARLGTAKIVWTFNPIDEQSCEDLELLVESSSQILHAGVSAAVSASDEEEE